MTRINVGGRWVQFVTEEVLLLTDSIEEAACFSWDGQVHAADLIRYHLKMDAVEKPLEECADCRGGCKGC
jgi:hypothetical protein